MAPGPAGRAARGGLAAVALLVSVAGSVAVGAEPRDSPVARAVVLAAVAAVAALALVAGYGRQRRTSRAWLLSGRRPAGRPGASPRRVAGAAVWFALVLAFVGWDAFSFATARPGLPTLSREIGVLTAVPGGRAVAFALWVAAGAYLATAGRARRA